MALDKDILGTAIFDVRQSFVNRTYDDLIEEYGTMDAARLAQAKAEAQAIIDHFKQHLQLNATVDTGLAADSFPVIGETIENSFI